MFFEGRQLSAKSDNDCKKWVSIFSVLLERKAYMQAAAMPDTLTLN